MIVSSDEVGRLLPLGSVVRTGGVKRLVVVARAQMVRVGEDVSFFDYGACPYPEGVCGDVLLYFNSEDIVEVVFEGFRDDEEAEFGRLIAEAAAGIRVKGDAGRGWEQALTIVREAGVPGDE